MKEFLLAAGPILLILLVLLALIPVSYVKAPPNKAAIISGLHKNPRVLMGRAGFKIPFLERVDWLYIGQASTDIKTDEYIPTYDFINVKVDAIAKVCIDTSSQGFELAMRNFLNMPEAQIVTCLQDSLQGNLREIIGTMDLKSICQNKKEFGDQVQEKAQIDMNNLGITIMSFNIQTVVDKNGLIENLGIENTAKIRQDAQIAQAEADRNVSIAKANASKEANEAEVEAEKLIAARNNELTIKQAELKKAEDIKKAEADMAYQIQEQEQRKNLEIVTQNADIARREKEIELQAREIEVTEKRLDADVKKTAEANKYAEMMKADAELYKRQKDAEAKLYEQEKEAAGIRAKGEAEAEAIKQKGLAEAETIDKKADAMKKYGQAAMLEMIVGVLPEMAKSIAEPMSAIDKVTIIGSDSNGVSEMSGNVPIVMAKVFESVKEACGIDLNEVVKANTFEAKTTHNLNIAGLPGKDETKALEIAENITETSIAE